MKELVEQYKVLKEVQTALEEKLKEVKEKKAEVERSLLKKLEDNNLDGTIVGDLKIMRCDKRVYNVEDWAKVHQYIMQTQDFSLLQARLSSTHLRELEVDGFSMEAIGVRPTDLHEVSIRKATRS